MRSIPCRVPLYGELKAVLLAWLVLPHTKGTHSGMPSQMQCSICSMRSPSICLGLLMISTHGVELLAIHQCWHESMLCLLLLQCMHIHVL